MARPAKRSTKPITNGVSNDGGSGESSGATPASGDGGGGGGDGGDGIIRPTLDGNGDGNGDGDSGPAASEPRRGRGRPRGSTSQTKAAISVSTLAEVISFAHFGIATVFKSEAWALDDGESKKLADAAAKVLRHHDTPAFSAYAMDWVALLMVAGQVYGPRIAVTVASVEKKPAPAPRPTNVQGGASEPVAEQGAGFIMVSDPMGSGRMVKMPVAN